MHMRLLLCLCLLMAMLAPVAVADEFAVVAFHDVVDYAGDLDDDGITVDYLIVFLEWLKANRWTVISLDDVERARRGEHALPERAILLTFDDGYRSAYKRVFPLLLAYRIPAVFALVGRYMDAPMDATVRYQGRDVPRSRFLSWEEAREMAASGYVEFASHGYDLHRAVVGNPLGGEMAAACTRLYQPGRGYESEDGFRARLERDLEKSRTLMAHHLGNAPRTLVWPFGRYNDAGTQIAKAIGFEFALTLSPEPGNTTRPMAIGRLLPTERSPLEQLVRELHFEDPLPHAQRFVSLDPAVLWTGDKAGFNRRLDRTLERLRTLGVSGVVLEAGVINDDGGLAEAWFPNDQVPVRADILSRIAWQCQTRVGAQAYVRLPVTSAVKTLRDPAKVRDLFHDLGVYVPASGMFVDDVPGLAHRGTVEPSTGAPWEVRQARAAVRGEDLGAEERWALSAFRAIEFWRPELQLIVVGGEIPAARPSGIADVTLVPHKPGLWATERLSSTLLKSGWLTKENFRRGGLWFVSREPLSAFRLETSARAFQRRGGTAFGWAADDPIGDRPKAAKVGKTVSTSTFPNQF